MALSPEEAGPLIAVKMSAGAADRLAKACARMEDAAWEATKNIDDEDRPEAYKRAMETYEWISWGASWMRNVEARIELEPVAAQQTGDPS